MNTTKGGNAVSKNNKDFSVFKIFGKITLVIFLPAWFAIICVFFIIGLLFDVLFTVLDSKNKVANATERKLNRFETRFDWLIKALFDYIKAIFS